LTSMLRDYELSKQNYAELLSKQNQSQLATNLEKRQEGQQFRLADPPNLPTVPSSPKRLKISLGSLGAGLALGLALAMFAEIRRPTFHRDREIQEALGIPFVIGVPLLITRGEKRRLVLRNVVAGCACSVLLFLVAAAELYVYRHG